MNEVLAIIKWLVMCLGVSMLMRPFLRMRTLRFIDSGFAMSFALGTALSFFVSWIFSLIGFFAFDEHVYIVLVALPLIPLEIRAYKRRLNGEPPWQGAGRIPPEVREKMIADGVYVEETSEFILGYKYKKTQEPGQVPGDGSVVPGQIPGDGSVVRSSKAGLFYCDKKSICRFLLGFLAFSVIFLIMVYIRGFKPEITSSTEQYMDYGFVQSIYRQKAALPEDIWYSGETLNYYYLGQAATAYLCRLSFVKPEYGYYFMLNTVFAALFLMCFELVEAVLHYVIIKSEKMGQVPGDGSVVCSQRHAICFANHLPNQGTVPWHTSILGGFAASLSVCCAANGHYLIYGLILPLLEKITGRSMRYRETGYFFPDSTTYIGNFPETLDKGKHEFMAYSVVLGDLHAHVINTLFVLPLLAILVDYALSMDARGKNRRTVPRYNLAGDSQNKSRTRRIDFLLEYINYTTIITGMLLGLFMGSNYWDFPIYFVVAGALILFHDLHEACVLGKTSASVILISIVKVLAKGAVILGIAELFAFPFNYNFVKMSSEIGLCANHSPIYKLAILWGFPLVVSVSVLILLYAKKKKPGDSPLVREGKPENRLPVREKKPQNRPPVREEFRLMITAIIGCAIGLVLMPEIVYVKDIYGDEYARFNTMFKLTYQAFILFGLVTGMAIGLFVMYKKRTMAIITGIFVLVLASYLPYATNQFIGNIFTKERSSGNCTDFLIEDDGLYAEMVAVHIINNDAREHVRILEAGGTSYTPDNKLSVFTGACTYAGWGVHEWMWRGSWDPMGMRLGEVSFFYESGQEEFCRKFLRDNVIDYVFIGPREREKYAINPEGFKNLLEEVFITEDGQYGLYSVSQ